MQTINLQHSGDHSCKACY